MPKSVPFCHEISNYEECFLDGIFASGSRIFLNMMSVKKCDMTSSLAHRMQNDVTPQKRSGV